MLLAPRASGLLRRAKSAQSIRNLAFLPLRQITLPQHQHDFLPVTSFCSHPARFLASGQNYPFCPITP
jgi:hypothetical protein